MPHSEEFCAANFDYCSPDRRPFDPNEFLIESRPPKPVQADSRGRLRWPRSLDKLGCLVVGACTLAGVALVGIQSHESGRPDEEFPSPVVTQEAPPLPSTTPLPEEKVHDINRAVIFYTSTPDSNKVSARAKDVLVDDLRTSFSMLHRGTLGRISSKVAIQPMGNFAVKEVSTQNRCDETQSTEMHNSIRTSVLSQAEQRGFIPKSSDLVVFALDTGHDDACSGQVMGHGEDRELFLYGADGIPHLGIVAHEVAHALPVLAASHTNEILCGGDPAIVPARADFQKCGIIEYGDPNTVMGNSEDPDIDKDQDPLNAAELVHMGAIPKKQIRKVDKPGTYTIPLKSLLNTSKGTKVVQIPLDDSILSKTLLGYDNREVSSYWLELSGSADKNPKQGISFKVYAGADANGLPFTSDSYIFDLNTKKYDEEFGATASQEGDTVFTDKSMGLTVDLKSISTTGNAEGDATITVEIDPRS